MYLAPPVAVVCGVLEASSGFGVGWRDAGGGRFNLAGGLCAGLSF